MYAENELLFPCEIVPQLKHIQNNTLRSLAERAAALPESDPESLAFCLMMIRLNGCLKCETDCYRAMRGCVACTRQTLDRLNVSDSELVLWYENALETVRAHLALNPDYQRFLDRRMQIHEAQELAA